MQIVCWLKTPRHRVERSQQKRIDARTFHLQMVAQLGEFSAHFRRSKRPTNDSDWAPFIELQPPKACFGTPKRASERASERQNEQTNKVAPKSIHLFWSARSLENTNTIEVTKLNEIRANASAPMKTGRPLGPLGQLACQRALETPPR